MEHFCYKIFHLKQDIQNYIKIEEFQIHKLTFRSLYATIKFSDEESNVKAVG